jgi:hypothetical protein
MITITTVASIDCPVNGGVLVTVTVAVTGICLVAVTVLLTMELTVVVTGTVVVISSITVVTVVLVTVAVVVIVVVSTVAVVATVWVTWEGVVSGITARYIELVPFSRFSSTCQARYR